MFINFLTKALVKYKETIEKNEIANLTAYNPQKTLEIHCQKEWLYQIDEIWKNEKSKNQKLAFSTVH